MDEDGVWTEKQQVAANESLAYAHANGLVLSLETANHLEYHYGVAAAEYQRIPRVEWSLSCYHLPALEIPPTVITESWAVPRRVMSRIEGACRFLADGERTRLEEDLCERAASRLRACRRRYKLELPLLCADSDEDCAELQRTATAMKKDEDRVRNHHLPLDRDKDTYAVPDSARHFAAELEATIQSETMAVSEQTVSFLVQLMSSMKWTEDDQEAFVQQQVVCKPVSIPLRIYVSPPLTPVSFPIEYFVPELGACAVSDASDLSSRLSDALEEAEQSIIDKTDILWPTSSSVETGSLEAMLSAEPLALSSETVYDWHLKTSTYKEEIESPLSMSLQSPTPPPEEFFATEEDGVPLPNYYDTFDEDYLGEPNELREPEHTEGLSYPAKQYDGLTAETILGFKDGEILSQAKIAVPGVGTESSLPGWQSVALDPREMFRWMERHDQQAFSFRKWPPSQPNDDAPLNIDVSDSAVAECELALQENLEVDRALLEKMKTLLSSSYNVDAALLSSVRSVQTRPSSIHDESFLDEPKEMMATQNPVSFGENVWDDMMSRWKRRKQEESAASRVRRGSQTEPPTPSQKLPNLRTPELLLGVNAFSDRSIPTPAKPDAISHPKPTEFQHLPGSKTSEESLPAPEPYPPILTSATLPKAILSLAIPRHIRTNMLQLLPNLEFIERDYRQYRGMNTTDSIDEDDEADIVFYPSTGLIITTIVGIRQASTGSQRKTASAFQERLARVGCKYESLRVLVYRNNNIVVAQEGNSNEVDNLPDFSLSDAMAFAQLQGFVRTLPCNATVLYVSGGEKAAARWAASLLSRTGHANCQPTDSGGPNLEHFLTEAETFSERFLRHAGLNVYDAQVVLGILRESRHGDDNAGLRNDDGRGYLSIFLTVSSEERLKMFGPDVMCRRAMQRVNTLLNAGLLTDASPSSIYR